MSQWTHVNAVIRLDSVVALQVGTGQIVQLTPHLGATPALLKAGDIPRGSEGPLKYTIWTNPEAGAAHNTLSVFGDLRDFGRSEDEIESLLAWFHRLIDGQLVRSALLEIDVEGQPSMTYRADNERGWFPVFER